jgi:hypothetical protein
MGALKRRLAEQERHIQALLARIAQLEQDR